MTRLLRRLLFAAALAAPSVAAQSNPTDPLPSRQILVMLKLAPQHFRSGGGYIGRYGEAAAWTARLRTAENVAEKNHFTLVDGWPMPLLGIDCYLMHLAPGTSIDEAVARVSRDPRVAWSEPMQLYQAEGATNSHNGDPLLPVEPAAMQWHLTDLHKVATGRGVSIAVIDSKIEVSHPDLVGHFIAAQNFLNTDAPAAEQHGTAIAGIIGAEADNGIGIAGIAPGAKLMALRACWQVRSSAVAAPTVCDSLGIARALQYAIDHKADVINLSLSGPPGILLQKLIEFALAQKASVIAAFDPSLPRGGFPASLPGVIAVADQSLQNLPAYVYGAPGRDIPTTQPGGKWYLVNGSSYAAAHVSGLIALVRERHSGSSVSLARAAGRVDACATLLATTRSCDCDCRIEQAQQRVAR